jgi:predicted RNA binding protein YcfA (HicA-like mRNA interferase family)
VRSPRDVGGDRLIRQLCRVWGYRIVNPVGSHVILVCDQPIHPRLPIRRHDPLGVGIFKKILNEVGAAKGVSQDDLLEDS